MCLGACCIVIKQEAYDIVQDAMRQKQAAQALTTQRSNTVFWITLFQTRPNDSRPNAKSSVLYIADLAGVDKKHTDVSVSQSAFFYRCINRIIENGIGMSRCHRVSCIVNFGAFDGRNDADKKRLLEAASKELTASLGTNDYMRLFRKVFTDQGVYFHYDYHDVNRSSCDAYALQSVRVL